MFVCKKCIADETEFEWRMLSYGPCEVCGKTGDCVDTQGALKSEEEREKNG